MCRIDRGAELIKVSAPPNASSCASCWPVRALRAGNRPRARAAFGEWRRFDTPADHTLGDNPHPGSVPTRPELLATGIMQLGGTPHLKSTWCPRVDASEIVDHDRDPLVCQEITVL